MFIRSAKASDRWFGKGANGLIGSLCGANQSQAADNDGLWVGYADTP
jgi:hypothetical protein